MEQYLINARSLPPPVPPPVPPQAAFVVSPAFVDFLRRSAESTDRLRRDFDDRSKTQTESSASRRALLNVVEQAADVDGNVFDTNCENFEESVDMLDLNQLEEHLRSLSASLLTEQFRQTKIKQIEQAQQILQMQAMAIEDGNELGSLLGSCDGVFEAAPVPAAASPALLDAVKVALPDNNEDAAMVPANVEHLCLDTEDAAQS